MRAASEHDKLGSAYIAYVLWIYQDFGLQIGESVYDPRRYFNESISAQLSYYIPERMPYNDVYKPSCPQWVKYTYTRR